MLSFVNPFRSAAPAQVNEKELVAKNHVRLVEDYLTKTTWKGAENANSSYSLQGLMHYLSASVVADYWLQNIYSTEIRQCVNENRIHIHDLGYLSAYCSGWSLEDVLIQGFGGVNNKLQCRPPKHLNTALSQAVNFLYTVQGELAGAQAFSSFDTYLAPFVRYDGLNEESVYRHIQSFVYSLNVPTRTGFQAPFTNITMDMICPQNMKDKGVIIGGELHAEWVYGDFQEEMDMINRAFAAVMNEGDGNGNIFTFPIPTYNLPQGFDWEDPRYEPIWEMTAKYGVPYFANFINSDLNPEDFRSMCCRLRLDIGQLHRRNGGLFGASPLTGSIGVVTVNLPNLALRSNGNKETFYKLLDDTLCAAKDSLEIKRKVIDENSALYPYAARYLSVIKERTGSYWTNHFSTIGVNGMNEAMVFLTGEGIATQQKLALEILEVIKEKLQVFQLETGNLYNLEATPAESTAYKLARKDAQLFPEADLPSFYTNSTALPVDSTEDLFEALNHQEALQCSYTGGTVFHAFLGEQLPNGRVVRDLLRSMTSRYRIPYITLTPTFSICKTHGYINGEQLLCPHCQSECLIYSRIVGYFRPVQDWNRGKKNEYGTRKTYKFDRNLLEGVSSPTLVKGDDPNIVQDSELYVPELADLPIAGFIKQTFSDFPGRTQASIMFTSRCNLSCGWCHNGPVVCGERGGFTAPEVLQYVSNTSHKTLVVSGGEPTIHRGLLPFLRALRRHGITIKLDTNGTNPDVVRQVIDEGLADFFAMDIKADPKRYAQVAGKKVDPKLLEESIELIKTSGIPHEFRTTVVPGVVDMEDLAKAKSLAGGKLTLQKFRKGNTNLRKKFRDYREHTEEEFAAIKQQVEAM